MKLEGIMLNEISRAEKDKYCMASLICGTLKKIKFIKAENSGYWGLGGGGGNGDVSIKGTNLQL